ncbi:glycosyltransferase family 4 protein [Amycolatopsis sp. NPDC059027]|uniref:glycosyltransferase family 4 protein n=1 Tax=unclassified Amycolatopsis TaxID=2618356 RepID=UPI00366F7863
MKRVLALTDAPDDVRIFCQDSELLLFRIEQMPASRHSFAFFEQVYQRLREACDLSSVDLVIAEYTEALPLLYLMRRDGYSCPALIIPHTNPYPLNILSQLLLVAETAHPGDLVICGSTNAAAAYERVAGIPARNICTFGIKNIYRPGDKAAARARLGLPAGRPILAYTGRFMADKGIGPLLEAYHGLRRRIPEALLVMSMTHVDTVLYNQLAARLEHVVQFQRLERRDTVNLYNAADLYVSGATSIFETYGKAPLEAMACGIPAVVPRWDGFPYFVGEHNGALADVDYCEEPQSSPFDFARVRAGDLADQCHRVLEHGPLRDYRVPAWATYDETMRVLRDVVGELTEHPRRITPAPGTAELRQERYSPAVRAFLGHYRLNTVADLVTRTTELGLIDRRDPGDPAILRGLHDEIFRIMDADPGRAENTETTGVVAG